MRSVVTVSGTTCAAAGAGAGEFTGVLAGVLGGVFAGVFAAVLVTVFAGAGAVAIRPPAPAAAVCPASPPPPPPQAASDNAIKAQIAAVSYRLCFAVLLMFMSVPYELLVFERLCANTKSIVCRRRLSST
jgi:hypothetical protein